MECPVALLRAYIAMYPRLVAEDSLSAVTTNALGLGALKKEEADKIMRQLEDAASGGKKRGKNTTNPAALASIGIGVEVV